MAKVIRLCGPANGPLLTDGIRLFVSDYDPDRVRPYWQPLPGGGSVKTTSLRTQAMKFPDGAAALEYWRRQSTVTTTRTDGQPNRPLTSLHAMIEESS